jgi:hypothetical protein
MNSEGKDDKNHCPFEFPSSVKGKVHDISTRLKEDLKRRSCIVTPPKDKIIELKKELKLKNDKIVLNKVESNNLKIKKDDSSSNSTSGRVSLNTTINKRAEERSVEK